MIAPRFKGSTAVNWKTDRDSIKEKDDDQPESRETTDAGVTRVPELHDAEAFVYHKLCDAEDELPDAEAELHATAAPHAIKAELHAEAPKCSAEPVAEALKRAAHPCMIAASFAFASLSNDLLQKPQCIIDVGWGI